VSSDSRGLASADNETKQRVAKAGGEARAQNPKGLAEAGRKGGEAVVEKYGHEHMAEIGRKGGEARAQDKESLREAGRKGGQS
jgi:general stress protein YciG